MSHSNCAFQLQVILFVTSKTKKLLPKKLRKFEIARGFLETKKTYNEKQKTVEWEDDIKNNNPLYLMLLTAN